MPSKGWNITLWVLQVLMAIAFVTASVTKLMANPTAVATFDKIGFGNWFMYLVGILELAGAIGLLIPRLSGLAALCLSGLLVGAIFTQFLVDEPITAAIPAGYLIFVALIAWGRRNRLPFRPSPQPSSGS